MSQGQGGGRPLIIFSDEQIAQVEALAAFLTLEQMADYFGIEKSSFYALFNRQPEVFQKYKKGRATKIVAIAKSLYQRRHSFGDNHQIRRN